jgi:hypothetical protein
MNAGHDSRRLDTRLSAVVSQVTLANCGRRSESETNRTGVCRTCDLESAEGKLARAHLRDIISVRFVPYASIKSELRDSRRAGDHPLWETFCKPRAGTGCKSAAFPWSAPPQKSNCPGPRSGRFFEPHSSRAARPALRIKLPPWRNHVIDVIHCLERYRMRADSQDRGLGNAGKC